ncbi:phytanoyl-CoA dioxygenase family protein [Pseudomonas tolaasii]|uniref:Phytanoyl-CoA dioxygenase family protein n=2 Tax=Pseudomonas tolaasii TaxID=29442 RepID=A0A7Y8AR63_PSETO|nr:phytanoyl-CoA dioxygenase family protein [Pseudomonas tolaasii]ARB25946.1 phytanoyl-CoA dioxygenase [Pseudomonas tolaasii]KAB0466981.1 phytanoyl-CoA dioxygenase [Pseudomonas tolaasii]MBW1249623.1 phytanoyl-CoA dioxygenase family protein [Pseudomonas tolaasii]MBW4793560.1 phytanoyl-CoA dioxygenase family protein [Pseudomonas tolaasii]MBY8939242.1 phytanoyl-CoA dioxygenase family protein [Pseudomonas tolaasii]
MSAFVTSEAVRLTDFSRICAQRASVEDYPLSAEVVSNVPIYQARTLRNSERLVVMNELHHLFRDGPGVMVVRGAYEDLEVVDRHSQVFEAIFAQEAARGVAADHFAKAGSNGRIWNSLQKAALESPASFVEYYANPLLGLIAEAWLGPGFQVTAQVNVVHPGGQAQQPHRDYHLGFQTNDVVERFPLPLHLLSQYLTLQGAVAHSDMPLETGPTQLLPFSQQYALGYLAWRRAEFIDYFQQHAVQLPLNKGDLLFFNPALFHAAGTNRTPDKQRMANLLQISSAFGKPMEALDRDRMMLAVYPELLANTALNAEAISAVIACTADGYSFPTNLDTDPPLQGLAPQTGQQLMQQALSERWALSDFAAAVTQMRTKRQA